MDFEIGIGSSIFMDCTFDSAKGLTVGANSVINGGCRIDTRAGIQIGDNVSISEDVQILTADHDLHTADFRGRKKPVSIGDFVFIGTRATILPGVQVGRGAVLAAGAVVTRDVESLEIVAGVPAKTIGRRMDTEDFSYTAAYRRLLH